MITRTVAVLALLLICASDVRAAQSWRDGDIIFHTSRSAQSVAIQRATHSRYSHVGIVFIREGQPYVFEAIATVRYTPLSKWTARGADSLADPAVKAKMRERYGARVPLEEPVISPAAIYDSPLLQTTID